MSAYDRLQTVVEAITFACIPVFPGFITLTAVAFPGVSIVPLPVALLVLGAMVVAVGIFLASAARPPRRAPAIWRPMAAWLAAGLLALCFGLNPRDGSVFVGIAVMAVAWHVHVERFYDAPGVARAIWWGYVLSGTIAVIAAIAMVLTRVPALQYEIANGRAVGTFVLPGELAGYLILFIPISYALARSAKSSALRAVAWLGCAAGAVAMVLTFSRTGWIGLAAALAFFVVVRSQRRHLRFLQAGAILAAAIAIVLLLFNEHHNPSENYTRISIWQAAIGMIDRFPLTGVGPFAFSKVYPLVRLPDGDPTAFHAHSLYLTIWAEMGVLGLLAFCWVLVAVAREWYRRIGEGVQSLLSTAIAAGLVGVCVQGLIDTVSVVIFGLLFPMLALVLTTVRAGACDA